MTDTTPAEGTEGRFRPQSDADRWTCGRCGRNVLDHDDTENRCRPTPPVPAAKYGPSEAIAEARAVYAGNKDAQDAIEYIEVALDNPPPRTRPPVPAAEDDAWWQGLTEVGCDAGHVVYVDDGDGTVYACPVCALAQARQQVADLRDAVADVLGGNEVGPGRLRDRLRAALAEPGGQVGETTRVEVRGRGYGKAQAMAERVADAVERRGVPAEVLPVPAPVVPDSAGVRERLASVLATRFGVPIQWADVDALLAVVGQGATAEQAEQAARRFVHERHPEWHDVGVGIVQGSHYRAGFAAGAKWWEQNRAAVAQTLRPAPSTTTEGESDE